MTGRDGLDRVLLHSSSVRSIEARKLLRRISIQWIIAVTLFLIALGFNLYRLGTPSVWYDEAFSVELARQPLSVLWHIIFGSEPNMELYYLFLHFWLRLTSSIGLHPTEFIVRFPSALFAAGSTVVIFLLGRLFIGTLAGVIASGLYLVNNWQLVYAQQARSYSLQLLLISIAWYALYMAFMTEKHARRWWLCYIAMMTLAIYAHLFSGLILLAQVVAVGGLILLPHQEQARIRKRGIAFIISLIVLGVLIIPMLQISVHAGTKTNWLPISHYSEFVYFSVMVSGNSKLYGIAIIACCIPVVLLVTLNYCSQYVPSLMKRSNVISKTFKANQKFALVVWLLLCWFFVPLITSYLISKGSLHIFSARYLIVIVPPLLLLVGLMVTLLPGRAVQGLFAIGIIVIALFATPYYYRSAQVEDWNTTTHWLLQRYQAGDGFICYPVDCLISAQYYAHAYPGAVPLVIDEPGAFSWDEFDKVDLASGGSPLPIDIHALAEYGAKHQRIFFMHGRIPSVAAAQRVQSTQRWLDEHYHYVGQLTTRTVTIRLYETNTGK